MATWKRCKAAMTVTARGLDRAEHLWPGLVVNLDRELVPGFTLGMAVAGREADFEDADDPTAPAPEKPVTRKSAPTRLEE